MKRTRLIHSADQRITLQAVLGHTDARSTQVYVQGVEGLIKGLSD